MPNDLFSDYTDGRTTFVTRDGNPELMAVTRTDDEGRILETLWERPALAAKPRGIVQSINRCQKKCVMVF